MGVINSKMVIEKSKEVEITCSYSNPESKRPCWWGGVGFGVSVGTCWESMKARVGISRAPVNWAW